MAEREALTAAYVRSILHYDPETGEFRWKERTPDMFASGTRPAQWRCRNWNSKNAGAGANCIDPNGYGRIRICGRDYRAHRLAWLWMTGGWPENDIDHVNLIKSDNRFANLREATKSQNLANIRMFKTNTSGYKGVSWFSQTGKWVAHIRLAGKSKNLGYFNTIEDAAGAYSRAAKEHFGAFARTK